ncbi:MAG: hypothetical protein U5J97_06975 [Trueperaceae bacterium]|nr:hypothetical protein [Trueperaceae bacterium]
MEILPLPDPSAPDPAAWTALEAGAIVVELPSVGSLRITGDDRIAFLHGQLAHDVRSLPVGGALRTLQLNVKGHALAEMTLHRREQDVHLAVEDGAAAEVARRLHDHVVFDQVTIEDLGGVLRTVTLQGPSALAVVQRAFDVAPPASGFAPVAFDDATLLVVRSRRSVPGGVDVHVLARQADAVVRRLVDAGAAIGDVASLEASRVEAGVPRAGREAGPGVLPQEAGLHDAISTRKGCYLGQETMARIEARAQVRRGLARLTLGEERADLAADLEHDRAQRGDAAASDVRAGDRVVGRLGTLVRHPRLGLVALAVVRSGLEPDATLVAAGRPAAIVRP